MKYLSLLLAVIHSVSALVLLIFSGWFIAACAIAGVDYADINFNYLLPAVVIRALALTRIASGYAQMWTGHNALLARVKRLRLDLFARIKNQVIERRAEGTEALAKHSESIASVSMAWSSHNLAVIFIILTVSLAMFLWLEDWIGIWLIFLLLIGFILVLGLRHIKQDSHDILELTTEFRHQSEHHLSSASIWHLRKQNHHPDMSQIYARMNHQRGHGERMLWWVQLFAFVFLIYLLNTGQYLGQAVWMIFVLLLLAAKDWLAPMLRSQMALADYQQSTTTIKQLPVREILSAPQQPELIQSLCLENFSASERHVESINLSLNKGEVVLLQGGSGSGKTSLLKAIAGLLNHTGKKQVNGAEIDSGFIDSWHYADQQPVMLSASLAANLRLAKPDASEEELHQALAFADLSHLTELSQWLGEQGRQLSGGELKRLNLARAYLFPAQLYLLDEPFEGLNTEQQEKLATAIEFLAVKAPVIIASHIKPKSLRINQVVQYKSNLLSIY